ncbi:uncharacterized protein LOC114480027 [Gouania willdenowi]|uniref:Uncharacterized LOC114480027 n=1 Tax=Gouania willdenowi TaxID=441366 RepID=A0A8C5I0S1_GOUWI|nr:uncharacterized protein LOC114480027 [Gouania willdenowi]
MDLTQTDESFEKTLPLDIFLLNYLKDKPKAFSVLQNQLSSIGCTAELKLDEERAVVKGIKKNSEGATACIPDVNQILVDLSENYTVHYVTEPKQIKKLLQDVPIETDDLKVYTERGQVVIVGEVEAVKEKLADLQKNLLFRKELVISEKYKLMEEEFNREMLARYPEVKTTRVGSSIVLEGSDREVQAGAAKLLQLFLQIQERRIQLPPNLVAFMDSSGAVPKYQARFCQTLRHPVSFEVGPDLVLSSLSSDAIAVAEAAILRDLKEEVITLQGDTAASTDFNKVKELLIKAKNEANRDELKVEIAFIPASSGNTETKVRLVGYSKEVQKLKETLQDFQKKQFSTQEIFNLSHPELVNYSDKNLDLTGMNRSGEHVMADLDGDLSNLTKDHLVITGPGVQFYFDSDGKKDKASIERTCKVLIKECIQDLLQNTAPVSDLYDNINNGNSQYTMPKSTWQKTSATTNPLNKTKLEIKFGKLVDEEVDVLVVPMISRRVSFLTPYGKQLHEAAQKHLQKNLMTKKTPGNIMSIDAPPSLNSTKIFFIECQQWDGPKGRSLQGLRDGLKKCFNLCIREGYTSVALPVIGLEEALKFPSQKAIQVLRDELMLFGSYGNCGALSSIHIVINPDCQDSETFYKDLYRNLSMNLTFRDQEIFESVSSDLVNITACVDGGVNLQLVFGSIVDESTDVVVNTTDFANFQTAGVCKEILAVAGPAVEAELRKANVIRGHIFQTEPGSFPCKSIFHVNGEKETEVIEDLVCGIIGRCDRLGYKSVAIPAICTGQGGLDPDVVANTILQAIKKSLLSGPLQDLTHIRLVLFKMNVFMAFKKNAIRIFHSAAFKTVVDQPSSFLPPSFATFDPSTLRSSSSIQQTTFTVTGSRRDVDEAMSKLKQLYQAQCCSQTFRHEELQDLPPDDRTFLKQLVQVLGVHVEEDPSGQGRWTVSGLKDAVQQVMDVIQKRSN